MRKWVTVGATIFIALFFLNAFSLRKQYMGIYHEGVALLESGDYVAAIERFNDIPNYENYQNISELLDNSMVCPQCGSSLK